MSDTRTTTSPEMVAWILPVADSPEVWGRSPAERAKRQLSPLKVSVAEGASVPVENAALLLRGDVIFHQSVLRGMKEAPGTALVDDSGQPMAVHLGPDLRGETRLAAVAWLAGGGVAPPAGLRRVLTTDVASVYNAKLRRRDDPYALRVNPTNLSAIEKRIFLGTYKGVTDLVTKYWWPVPARIVTGWCVRLGLSPNFVTGISGLLAVLVGFLFAQGEFGWGLFFAWPMTFLDTVDGKLARVTLTSSKFGDLFDHGIDLLHPPAWYFLWGVGLSAGTSLDPRLWPLMWLLFGTYAVGRLCEGYFTRRFGFHLHVWRRFDSVFRLVLARRNPNMIILTLAWLVGQPYAGLWLVAAWHAVTLAVHLVQVAQSVVAARRGPLHSWLEFAPDKPARA